MAYPCGNARTTRELTKTKRTTTDKIAAMRSVFTAGRVKIAPMFLNLYNMSVLTNAVVITGNASQGIVSSKPPEANIKTIEQDIIRMINEVAG